MSLRKLRIYLMIGIIFSWFGNLSILSAAEDEGEYNIWTWKLGIDERIRGEFRHDFDFNERIDDNGSWLFHRLKLSETLKLTDEYLNEKAVFYIEALDAQAGSYQMDPQFTQVDDFDFHQGYIKIFDILNSGIDVKGGRMEAKYGNGRLIAQPSWSNRMRHFDGGIVSYRHEGLQTDILYLHDVKYDDNRFNQSLSSEYVAGAYGWYQKNKIAPLYEAYFLPQIIKTGTSDIKRYTVGGRLQFYLPYQIMWETEAPYQFGKNGSRDIKAYAFNVTLSKGWETTWKPRITTEYNLASGDNSTTDNEINTFIPLYQSTHEPYGLLDYFRWQNMKEIAWKIDVSPTDKLKITPQTNFHWLESKNDSWYNSSGTAVRTKTTGERGSYIGNETSLRVYYDFTKNLKWENGYAHFFTSDFVEDTGAHDDVDWVYSQMTFKY